MVTGSTQRLAPTLEEMGSSAMLPGWQQRVVDGNRHGCNLDGTLQGVSSDFTHTVWAAVVPRGLVHGAMSAINENQQYRSRRGSDIENRGTCGAV
ncbi:hypothetical protein B1219_27280 [Pseudomonas ogarae]|nr:hypothetical protein B1219_31075 [Pseudomonas ogarae]OPG69004.1 hypothetical protein B1219_27280 [Pseudomonas ogarae]OPG79346.1 hypothetical protein B1218_10785 [Pseudomonas ogarae]